MSGIFSGIRLECFGELLEISQVLEISGSFNDCVGSRRILQLQMYNINYVSIEFGLDPTYGEQLFIFLISDRNFQ